MPGEHIRAADILQHRARHFARERALRVLAQILATERELRARVTLGERREIRKRRQHRDFTTVDASAGRQRRGDLGHERRSHLARAVHLPVSGDELASHGVSPFEKARKDSDARRDGQPIHPSSRSLRAMENATASRRRALITVPPPASAPRSRASWRGADTTSY